MNIRNMLMISAALFGLQVVGNLDAVTINQKKKSSTRDKAMSAISSQEKAIRRELRELLEKKPVNTLTLADVKRVRLLFKDLYKINRDLYEELDSQYINEESCCPKLSPFEIQETKLIVTDLLNKGSLSGEQDKKVTELLSRMYDVTDSGTSMCGTGDDAEDAASLKKSLKEKGYYKLTDHYKKVTGKQFKPVREEYRGY